MKKEYPKIYFEGNRNPEIGAKVISRLIELGGMNSNGYGGTFGNQYYYYINANGEIGKTGYLSVLIDRGYKLAKIGDFLPNNEIEIWF